MQKPIIRATFAYILGLLLGHGFLYFPWAIDIRDGTAWRKNEKRYWKRIVIRSGVF